MEANKAEISRSLQLLFAQGDTIELRAFANGKTVNGYYQRFDRLGADAAQLNNELQAQCYVVLNPVQADLHDKRPDTVGACGKGDATADPQATCRRWLVIDCDPTKEVKGASATDEERSAAERLARQVYTYLAEQRGLPAPAVATSGNGYWLLFRLADFPNDASSRWVLRQLLVQLADQFDNQAAVVDRTTFSAAQLVKMLGTVARKGESTAQRPHRLSQLLSVPDTIEAVTWEQITAITGQPPVADQHAAASEDNGSAWDIAQLLADRGLQYTADREYITASGEQATRYELEQCPFNAEHNDRSACLIQWSNGAVSFSCHHNGCAGRDWQALKQAWQLPDAAGISAGDIILPAAPQQTAQQQKDLLIVRSLDVQPEPIGWLWQDRLVIGGINLCCGRGGIGKTYFLCDLVARITNDALPAPNGQPLLHGRVLYSTGEDHLGKIIEPRMQAHGVDRSRLEYIKGLPAGPYVQLLDVLTHADNLRAAIAQRPDTVAMVLDPISSFQGAADSNKVAQVRRFTAVLTQLSEEFSIAVLGIHHFNKGKRDQAGDSISGSHAYRDAARSIWLFALDGNDPERRLAVCDKHNWAEQRPPGLAYRIEQGKIAYEAEPLDLTPDELMQQSTQQPVDVACSWLLAQLSTGPQPAINLQIAAATEGIADRTLNRAKKRLGIVASRAGNAWQWELPNGQQTLES